MLSGIEEANGQRVLVLASRPIGPPSIEARLRHELGSKMASDHSLVSPRAVVIKPNWIQEGREDRSRIWEPVITDPLLVACVAEEMTVWLSGGRVSICDAPHTYASFPGIIERGGLRQKIEWIRSVGGNCRVEVVDLRREVWLRKDGVVVERRPNPQDPRGYGRCDLGPESLFFGFRGEGRYYGADYDSHVVNDHHRGETQEYLLSGTAISCGLFVNMPKLKTHKKTGITCALKNLVGINGDKNWLPHHTEGSPRDGGDEYPDETWLTRLERTTKKAGRKLTLAVPGVGTWVYRMARKAGMAVLGDSETVIRNGNWEGNDTCWRMALDLNRALMYGNTDGTMREAGQAKSMLIVVDGIIGGEGNGPLCPDPVESNVVIVGTNPASVDAVACMLMGFDPRKVPIVREAFAPHRWPIADCKMEEVEVYDERVGGKIPLFKVKPAVSGGFRPHFGWPSLYRSSPAI